LFGSSSDLPSTPLKETAMADPQAQFLDFYRGNLEAMLGMARSSLDEAERLRTRQLESIRAALEQNAELAREVAGAKSAEELLGAQAKFASHQLEVALGYWGRLFEAANRCQVSAMKSCEEQSASITRRMSGMLEGAPAGAEPIVGAMKSFLQAAQAAYGIGAQATEQAAKLTEAQFVTASAGIREAIAAARQKAA
jgi:phasin family protein